MIAPAVSTIAQLVYQNEQALDFARIVAELETVLSRLGGDEVEIDWDCNDLITFDLADTRILLSCADLGRTGREACLTVACGPSGRSPATTDHQALCARLVQRIQARFVPTLVLWSEASGRVDADLIDQMVEAVPSLPVRLPPVDSILDKVVHADRLMTGGAAPRGKPAKDIEIQPVSGHLADGSHPKGALHPKGAVHLKDRAAALQRDRSPPVCTGVANDLPDLPPPADETLARLRAALYPPPDRRQPVHTTPMRLTVHCFNTTLILICSPLGAALMTYSILKGEDIRLSGRLMAVAGTIFAVAQTPMGQAVKAMAGV